MTLNKLCSLVTVLAVAWGTTASAQIIADSIADFPAADNVTGDSKQGINGWSYGYHVDTVTAGPGFSYTTGDFIPFPDNAGPGTSPTDFWTGTAWDWHSGNPPWTSIGTASGHPNGTNSGTGGEQWAIRRWTADESGAVNIDFSVNKTNTAGGGNNGVTAHLFVNGANQGSIPIVSTDGAGKTWTVHVPNLNVGDIVDLALDPTGPSGGGNANLPHDGSDGSNFSTVVNRVSQLPTQLVADSIADFSGTQGTNGWTNGYHNLTANGTYDATPGGTDDFIEFGPGGDAGFTFNGSAWDFDGGATNPPWTFIDDNSGHPNGANNAGSGGEQWAIRRYEAEVGGDLIVEAFLAAENTGGGDGTTLRVLHNGDEIGQILVGGTDGVGLTDVFEIPDVMVGDFIDLALDPNGDDGFDSSAFSAQIFSQTPEPGSILIWSLIGAGLFGVPVVRRWRKRRSG